MVVIAKLVVPCIMQYLSFQILKLLKDMNIVKKYTMFQSGKDAAVAYGSIDFKFKNNNEYDLKIYASPTTNNITVRIVKI